MQLKLLRSFVAAASKPSFREAADHLHITQSALTRQMQELEADLGIRLFERAKQRVYLTSAGQAYLKDVMQILKNINAARERAMDVQNGTAGRLHIGFNHHAAREGTVSQALHAFRSRGDCVDLRLEYFNAAGVLASLRKGRIDAGFLIYEGAPEPGTRTLKIKREHVLLALPEWHRLSRAPEIHLADLAQEPFVMFPRAPNTMLHDLVTAACNERAFHPRIVQEVNNEQMILSLIALGMGLGFVLDSVANTRPQGVVLRKLADLNVTLELDLVWLESNRNPLLTPLVKLVKDMIDPSLPDTPAAAAGIRKSRAVSGGPGAITECADDGPCAGVLSFGA